MYTEKWKLTDDEIEIITQQGGDIALAQEGKKKAFIKAGGVILNPDALPDLYEALKYVVRELDKADIIKKDSIFMEMPNKALAKAEGK